MESENRTNGITLLPCPFCGQETRVSSCIVGYYVMCHNDSCIGSAIDSLYTTESQAIEAWNTRAERTCRAELKGFDPSKTVSTCHYACSACGYAINHSDSYCKSCGAKVVD